MSHPHIERLRIQGVPEVWCRPLSPPDNPDSMVYRPAVLVECTLNFRSLRAGLNHSEDRSFTAWLPKQEMAIDWDSTAINFDGSLHVESASDQATGYDAGIYSAAEERFKQYLDELINKLVRHERLKIYYNSEFELFSSPGEQLEDFLSQVAEAALRRVEPELKNLRRRFDLQLEQIREALTRRGQAAEGIGLDRLQLRSLQLSESENRLASIFSTLAGTVFGTAEPRQSDEQDNSDDADLREDLDRIEQEASDALRALYDEYMTLANEYDMFEIGLQPDNIQVLRLALLWVPVEASA
jgi:hypothetical protein